ncbi:MAG: hypothetical protein ACOCUM_00335 [Thiohalospira sp.]
MSGDKTAVAVARIRRDGDEYRPGEPVTGPAGAIDALILSGAARPMEGDGPAAQPAVPAEPEGTAEEVSIDNATEEEIEENLMDLGVEYTKQAMREKLDELGVQYGSSDNKRTLAGRIFGAME